MNIHKTLKFKIEFEIEAQFKDNEDDIVTINMKGITDQYLHLYKTDNQAPEAYFEEIKERIIPTRVAKLRGSGCFSVVKGSEKVILFNVLEVNDI